MKHSVVRGYLVSALITACLSTLYAREVRGEGPQVAHMVYFSLHESSPETKRKLLDACKKYLSDHDGTVYFSVGVLAEDMAREVNDRNFDVSLNLVFQNKAAHDQYQNHPRHLKFIAENKQVWKNVRVFDSYLATD